MPSARSPRAGVVTVTSHYTQIRRNPQASGDPGAGPQHADLPGCGGGADEAGQHRGGRVAADRHDAPRRVVGQRPTAQSGGAGEPVAEALDQAPARRRARRGWW